MHAKFSSIARFLFLFILCVKFVCSGEVLRKLDKNVAETTLERISEYSNYDGSKHPHVLIDDDTVSTANNDTAEATKIFLNMDTEVDDSFLINPTKEMDRHNETNESEDTTITDSEVSRIVNEFSETTTILSNEKNERFTGTVTSIGTTIDDFKMSTTDLTESVLNETTSNNGPTKNPTTVLDLHGVTTDEGINITTLAFSTTNFLHISSETSTKLSNVTPSLTSYANYENREGSSSESTSSTPEEQEMENPDTSTTSIFQISTEESVKKENNPEWTSPITYSNGDYAINSENNDYTTNNSNVTSTNSEQNPESKEEQTNEFHETTTNGNSRFNIYFQGSVLTLERPADDKVVNINTGEKDFYVSTISNDYYRTDSKNAQIYTQISIKEQGENVPSESEDLESTTESSDISDLSFVESSESLAPVIKKMEDNGNYPDLYHRNEDYTSDTDTTDVYTQSTVYTTNKNFDQATTIHPQQGELYGNDETTTSKSELIISEDDSFGYKSSMIEHTTLSRDDNPESTTSTMTAEYPETTENLTDISTTEETTSFAYPTWTSLNLVQMNSETTTEEVSSTTNSSSSTNTPTEYPNHILLEITSPFTKVQTREMSAIIYPDDYYLDSSSTVIYPSSCNGIEITSHKITVRGKTYIEVAWTLSYFNSKCDLKINLSCNSTDDSSDWIITHQDNSTNVEGSEPASYLENLSEFTNYSCIGQLLMKMKDDEIILSSRMFNVTTKPEVPSNIYFNITDVRARSFHLSWSRPMKIPGNLRMYHIIIKDTKINHYIHNCDFINLSEQSISFSDGKNDISYNFTNAKPDRLYEVKILAEDEAGNSTGTTKKIVTKSSRSTEPLNVTSILQNYSDHCNGDEYNTTLQLIWELPCDTNGKLLEFEVKISEIVDSDITSDDTETITYKIPKNPDIKNLRYELMVPDLNASCIYEISIAAVTAGNHYGLPANHTTQRTEEGCPSEPVITNFFSPNSSSFILEWDEPAKYYGEIIEYNVIITESGPKHWLIEDPGCPRHPKVELNETTNSNNYTFNGALPNFGYKFFIEARTSAGLGNPSQEREIITKKRESEPVRNLEIIEIGKNITDEIYEYKVRITFQEPCNTNGPFKFYLMSEEGSRHEYQNVSVETKLNRTSHDVILRKPEYNYKFKVKVISGEDDVSQEVTKDILTIASIPKVNEKKVECTVDDDNPTEIKVTIGREIFGHENGEITHYDIFLFEDVDENLKSWKPRLGFCNKTCPSVPKTYEFFGAKSSLQFTSDNWNPFTGDEQQVSLSIGQKDHCSVNEFCQSLSENTNYIVLLRGYTRSTYRDVFYAVKTGTKSSSVGFFIVIFIIFILILALGIYLYSKNERFFTIRFRSIPNTSEEVIPRHLIGVKHFKSYYNKTQNDPTILRKQYEEIEDEIKKYKDENVHTTFALKPENRRKNRYTNILPYDEYRVKLQMDEDDEISSDYINASYIRGVSGEVEYIATQGPLEHTCKDFWKMIIQENVTVIVMVSQFIEKEKEKCFKYFPNNHENMMICEDLEVKCLTELQFDTHCIRTLLIRKDLKQFSVIHMQYLDWPDFGCPSGTHNMLSFCQEVRDRIQIEKGLMAVHCSAGVGRTGTLISLDILLQTMQKKKDISIFECVMDLRKQRTHMVQTEKQYVYIYTCLNDVLENCSLYSFDDRRKDELHIYVNVDGKQRSIKGSQCEEKESAF